MKSLILIIIGLSFLNSPAFAAKRKRINTKKLEKKYWTTKGYKTGVVQGRTFFKEKRLRLSLENMVLLNDKYSDTDGLSNFRGEALYYLTERLAVGGFFENLSLDDNTALREMTEFNGGSFKLSHVKASRFIGGSLEFVPIYSKLSWMNKKIIYLDFSVSPKFGLATYEQQRNNNSGAEKTTPVVGLDLATNVFINKNFSVNLAYRTRAYQAEVVDWGTGATVDNSKLNFHSFFTLGLNVFF